MTPKTDLTQLVELTRRLLADHEPHRLADPLTVGLLNRSDIHIRHLED